MSFFTKNQINNIVKISLEAGEIAKNFFYSRNFTINKKSDNSDVSSADIAISDFIYNQLGKLFPQIPIICEEKSKLSISGEYFFLIDPIDGTAGYVNNSDQFSINIALIGNKKPLFGLIYAPIFENGKIFYNDENQNIIKYDNLLDKLTNYLSSKDDLSKLIPQKISDRSNLENKLTLITSKRSSDKDIENFITQYYSKYIEKYQVKKLSSAVKFFDLLQGNSDIYIHFNQTMEWDIAAGHSLVELINFRIKTISKNNNLFNIGHDLNYGKENYLNSGFIIS